MLYQRMPIEKESPEEIGYGSIDFNLAESSVADLQFDELNLKLDQLKIEYIAHRGGAALRNKILEGTSLNEDDVLVTNGAAGALFIINSSLLEVIDHLIVVRPNYSTNIEVPKTIGCAISYIDLKFEEEWRVNIQAIEKAISLTGNTTEGQANKQYLEKRLATIKQNMVILPPYTAPELPAIKVPEASGPQMMAYAGGMVAPNSTNLNGRIGYFVSGSSNASFDFGMWKAAEYTASNIGLSIYNRQKSFVSGAGLLMNSANGNSAFSFKISVGFSKMNKSRNSSFDVFLDMNKGFKADALTTFNFSIGTSRYFGKRK